MSERRNRKKGPGALAGAGVTQQMEPDSFVSDRDSGAEKKDVPASRKRAAAAATRKMEPKDVQAARDQQRQVAGLVEPVERELPGAGAHRRGGRGNTMPMPPDE